MSLTPSQENFAQHVASGKNQSESYRQAYPKSKMWKEEAVWSQASQLMANGKVALRVAELQKIQAARLAITSDRVLKEVAAIAFFDIRRIFNEDGSLKKVFELDDESAAAIASIESIDIGGDGQLVISKKFKASDKNAALEKLMKHLGLYEIDNTQKKDPLAELLAALGGNIVSPSKDFSGDE